MVAGWKSVDGGVPGGKEVDHGVRGDGWGAGSSRAGRLCSPEPGLGAASDWADVGIESSLALTTRAALTIYLFIYG